MIDYLIIFILWLLFYAIHSIMATNEVKAFLEPVLGGGRIYRLIYSIISSLCLIFIFGFILKSRPVYVIESSGWLRYSGMVLGTWGTIILTLSFKEISTLSFLGFKKDQKKGLITHGIHSQMRHPIYTGTLLIFIGMFLFIPSYQFLITLASLIIYLPIGISLEENKLLQEYGEDYKIYKSKVKTFTPWF